MAANLHHVVLTVRDIDASVGWYTDLFGFAELARDEHFGGSGGRTVLLGAPDWSMGIGLASHPTNGGETFDRAGPGSTMSASRWPTAPPWRSGKHACPTRASSTARSVTTTGARR